MIAAYSQVANSGLLFTVIVIKMQTITIESYTKLHAITIMFIAKKGLKVDKSRDFMYFSLFLYLNSEQEEVFIRLVS